MIGNSGPGYANFNNPNPGGQPDPPTGPGGPAPPEGGLLDTIINQDWDALFGRHDRTPRRLPLGARAQDLRSQYGMNSAAVGELSRAWANPTLARNLIMQARRGQFDFNDVSRLPRGGTLERNQAARALFQLQQDFTPVRDTRAAMQAARAGRATDPVAFQSAMDAFINARRTARQHERRGWTAEESRNLVASTQRRR